MDRFLIKRDAQNAIVSEVFSSKSKLQRTPVKQPLGKKRGGKKSENRESKDVEEDDIEDSVVEEKGEVNTELAVQSADCEFGDQDKREVEGEEWEDVMSDVSEAEDGEREEWEYSQGKNWWREFRYAEVRMKKVMMLQQEELVKNMKRWWEDEMKRINEENEQQMKCWLTEEFNRIKEVGAGEREEMCGRCESMQNEVIELGNTVRELRVSADRERLQWDEERRMLLNIIQGEDVKGGGRVHEKEKMWRRVSAKEGNVNIGASGASGVSRDASLEPLVSQGTRERASAVGSRQDAGDLTESTELLVRSGGGARDGRENEWMGQEDWTRVDMRRPRPLNEGELKEEGGRRAYRRNNVSVYFPNEEGNTRERILDTIFEKCGNGNRGNTMLKHERGGLIVMKFKELNEKLEMMTRRRELKGTNIWIKDDSTKREKEVQNWLTEVAGNERRCGRCVEVRYMRICFGDRWWRWNDRRGNIEQENLEWYEDRRDRSVQQPFRTRRRQ